MHQWVHPPRRTDRRWPPSPRMRAYALRCIDAGEPARAVARRLRLAPGTVASWCHRRELRAERAVSYTHLTLPTSDLV